MTQSSRVSEYQRSDGPVLELLPFYCPIEAAVHPEFDAIEQACISWIDDYQLYFDDQQRSRLIGTRAALIYSMALPNAEAEKVADVAKWLYWGFATDDLYYDNGPTSKSSESFLQLAAQLVRICEEPRARFPQEVPYSDSLRDLVKAITRHATPLQTLEWASTARAWFFGMAWDVSNTSSGRTPSINDYLMMRMHTGGLASWVTTLNIAQGVEILPKEAAGGPVRALIEAWSTFALLINDISSYAKERRNGDSSSNIISVIANERDRRPQEAVREAYALCDAIARLYMTLRDRIHSTASDNLRKCIENLDHTWRGIIEWGFLAARYNVDLETGEHFQQFPGWISIPRSTNLEVLPYPAISWWWDELEN
ncbi:hypothetical protein AB1484_29930 [Parafrankia sp. FMc6]|uniref:terpene synthase family protein n=1 Tax=Parafrankia soli TaxID=2599596 RepID=UPI0034D78813